MYLPQSYRFAGGNRRGQAPRHYSLLRMAVPPAKRFFALRSALITGFRSHYDHAAPADRFN